MVKMKEMISSSFVGSYSLCILFYRIHCLSRLFFSFRKSVKFMATLLIETTINLYILYSIFSQ